MLYFLVHVQHVEKNPCGFFLLINSLIFDAFKLLKSNVVPE